MLKDVPSGGTRVEELRQEEAIWIWSEMDLQTELRQRFSRRNCLESTADLESDNTVRCGSHWDGSPQDGFQR